MRFSSLPLLTGLVTSAFAQDLLFLEGFQYKEYDEAVELGISTKLVTEAEWAAMKTEDFAKYKALVVPDPRCGGVSNIKFLEDSKNEWSPAVTGNIILIGTDPSFHFGQGKAKTLIDNSIKFAAAGTTPAGVPQTGLYYALSCYYESDESAKVEELSWFGDFTVRGNLDCYNKVHLVADSPAMSTLDDESLSNWRCSVHEAFSSYPSVGTNGFQALAIAQDILGVGSQTFGDGTRGLPYIISRGATPAKCGDGVWDKKFGEECDDGNRLNGDGCSLSCKCESGKPKGDGTCYPKNTTTPEGPTGTSYHSSTGYPSVYPSATSGYPYSAPYGNSSATPTYSYPGHYPAYTPPPYATPACPTGPKIIGVEYIVEVTYSSTTYVPCATKERPIYDVSTSALPCYVCAMSSDYVTYTSTDFITVTKSTCIDVAKPTYFPPVVYPCKTCEAHTFTETDCLTSYTDSYTEYPAVPYVTPEPHSHVSKEAYPTGPVVSESGGYPVYTKSGGPVYPTASWSKTSVKPTGTGAYYTKVSVAEYTGAAVKRDGALGVVGGLAVAVAALM